MRDCITQKVEQRHRQNVKGRVHVIEKTRLHFACLCSCVCLHVSRGVEGGHYVFASSTSAPDLGGEAAGELVVTDGSSNLGYRSSAEKK